MIPEKTILDDDLDEAFLHEVDAICEKRSTVKKERLGEEAVENKGCVVGGYKDLGSCRLRGLLEGIDPSNILAMTFTIAAASEMRDQIGIVARKAVAKEIEISTFNSFCFQLAGNMQKSVESNPCCAPLWCKNFFANEDKANSSFPILFLFCLGSSSTCSREPTGRSPVGLEVGLAALEGPVAEDTVDIDTASEISLVAASEAAAAVAATKATVMAASAAILSILRWEKDFARWRRRRRDSEEGAIEEVEGRLRERLWGFK
ncbi:hypothetical protein ZIOFF_041376 [Zingiber officinale]|uniref:UvrD-like helicase ATP-binding domain-containing protein n=1 Tax=Zingiber officinale TaxID=94328 RepID=A0A8J5G6J0_ZINOF|nr:hypothetical protein ZIOFF_041376 [Zingiber officinale]